METELSKKHIVVAGFVFGQLGRDLARACALLCMLVFTTPHSEAQMNPIGLERIELGNEERHVTLAFQFSATPGTVRSFPLAGPPRLVVDIEGAFVQSPSSTYSARDPLIGQVRTGYHPNRLRLVVDFQAEAVPHYTVEQNGTTVRVQISARVRERNTSAPQILFSAVKDATLGSAMTRTSPDAPRSQPEPPEASLASKRTMRSGSSSPSGGPLTDKGRYHLEQGQIFYNAGKLDKAIEEWKKTLDIAPKTAQAHHLLGLAFRDKGNHTNAAEAFEEAVSLQPDNATMHVHFGRALEALNKDAEAFATYRKALELVPSAPYVHNRLAYLFAAKQDWQGAANEWYETTQLAPDYAYAYANYGEALENLNRNQDALVTYETAVPICVRFMRAFEDRAKQQKAETLCADLRTRIRRLQSTTK